MNRTLVPVNHEVFIFWFLLQLGNDVPEAAESMRTWEGRSLRDWDCGLVDESHCVVKKASSCANAFFCMHMFSEKALYIK